MSGLGTEVIELVAVLISCLQKTIPQHEAPSVTILRKLPYSDTHPISFTVELHSRFPNRDRIIQKKIECDVHAVGKKTTRGS